MRVARRGLAGLLLGAGAALGAAAQPVGGSLMPCPATLEAFEAASPFDCACWRPEAAPVQGTDTYTAGSGICAAAVHAGTITTAGGTLRVIPLPGQGRYAGSPRNGIASADHGPAARSFRTEPRTGGPYGVAPR